MGTESRQKRPFSYQKNARFFGQIAPGIEKQGRDELKRLGARDVKPGYRGIYFSADHTTVYRINYRSRLLTRVLAPLLTFDCHSDAYLYKTAKQLPWQLILNVNKTFAIYANVANSNIKHSRYAALKVKDAIVDQFREREGKRPSISTTEPDVSINLFINRNRATLSLDLSGGSLHKRGYRIKSVDAPMQETVAAAILELSGWHGKQPLIDPMCGSGTILAEALIRVCRVPAGLLRTQFGFPHMPDYQDSSWQQVKAEAARGIRGLPQGLLSGSDSAADAIAAATANLAALPGGEGVRLTRRAFQSLPGREGAVIICNPPYGVRISSSREAAQLMRAFGTYLRERCRRSDAWVYLGDPELQPHIDIEPAKQIRLTHGGLKGVLAHYEIS